MDHAAVSLQAVLILLACGVAAVVLCRSLQLPAMIGYLVTGLALGPHALGLVSSEREETRLLAEIGVVFLMFSIGLEFSLSRLMAMRRVVFGLGLAQVLATIAIVTMLAVSIGWSWQSGLALGGIVAMSSTAIVSKLLAERLELDSPHGRQVIGVLLFQDLAVVPLIVLIPALGRPAEELGAAVAIALGKAAAALAIVILAGPRVMRGWLGVVARRRSHELFVLNVLLVILLMAYLTALGGTVHGAGRVSRRHADLGDRIPLPDRAGHQAVPRRAARPFLRHGRNDARRSPGAGASGRGDRAFPRAGARKVRAHQRPFARLRRRARHGAAGRDLRSRRAESSASCCSRSPAPRTSARRRIGQLLLAAMILSMLATPFLIQASDRIVLRLSRSEWMQRSLALHRVAVESLEAERHVIILGYGRNGQRLARLLGAEGVRYVALDLDPERVREAAAAGDTVVFADSSRREALIAAGISRAAALVVTFADANAAVRVLQNVHELNPRVPVVVRARDESDIERLVAAGASEVVPEAFESGVMLASHTLVWLGVPLRRVMRRVAQVREEHYELLRGLFRGEGDAGGAASPRLHSVMLDPQAYAVGRPLTDLKLDGVQVRAVRRAGVRKRLERRRRRPAAGRRRGRASRPAGRPRRGRRPAAPALGEKKPARRPAFRIACVAYIWRQTT